MLFRMHTFQFRKKFLFGKKRENVNQKLSEENSHEYIDIEI